MRDEYRSIQAEARSTLKVEGSKFIASASPVEKRIEADDFLAATRKKYFDATHHSFAYAIGADLQDFRYSDGGEPSGTAGIKIFSAIQAKDLSDLVVVVSRYFGGTKLGIGGLGRAYFDSATLVLSEAAVIPKIVAEELEITFPYDETNGVMTVLSRSQAKIKDTVYDDDVTLRVSIRKGKLETLTVDLKNVTRGNLSFKNLPPLGHSTKK